MKALKDYLRIAYPPGEAWTGHDKTLHFSIGFLLGAVLGAATHPLAGLLAAVTAGIGKEVYDYQHRDIHTPSIRDTVVTILGGLVGAGAIAWSLLWFGRG